MYRGYYESPIGYIEITAEQEYIVGVKFEREIKEEKLNDLIIECKNQLEQYFKGERKEFELNIKFVNGTDFQRKVWNSLKEIGYGDVVSYKYIAERIGNPKAVRAVGGANNKNPISIIVPCHRVIGVTGKLVGYAEGLDKKEFLLKLEEAHKKQ